MAFPLINSWSPGDELTSTQMNSVAVDLTNALDKTGDGIASSPAGGISGAIDLLSTGTIRSLDASNNVLLDIHGANITVNSDVTFESGSSISVNSGTAVAVSVSTGGAIDFETGSNLDLAVGASLTLEGDMTSSAGSTITMNGTTLTMGSGCTATFGGGNHYGTTETSSNYAAGNSDTFILVDSSGGAISITLVVFSSVKGRVCTVKDFGGQAATHHITIHAGAGQTIEGNSSIDIDFNYGWFTFVSTSGTAWYIVSADKNESP